MISSSDILHGKILIVDDQQANIMLLEMMLRGAGYDAISSTQDANEAFELHRKNRYDLILLDLEMPDSGYSGFQVMEKLRGIEPDDYLPVIVVTAHHGHKLHALQAGARDFISKPFELGEALARIHSMLEVRLLYVESRNRISALERRIQEMQEMETSRDLLRDEIKHPLNKIAAPQGGANVKADDPAAWPQPHTLLYIEDKPDSLKLVQQIMARAPNIQLLTALTGNSGVEIARTTQPEAILTDINLPDISGFKVLKTLLADNSTAHIPVIAFSANAMPLNIESGLEAGFFRYLTKPIKVEELMEALDSAFKFAHEKTARKVS